MKSTCISPCGTRIQNFPQNRINFVINLSVLTRNLPGLPSIETIKPSSNQPEPTSLLLSSFPPTSYFPQLPIPQFQLPNSLPYITLFPLPQSPPNQHHKNQDLSEIFKIAAATESPIMTTKSRTLEITALSAEELRIDNKFIKKNAYAVFSIDPRNYRMTKIDALGGSYPSWNEKFVMDLPAGQSFIIVEVKIRSSSGDRSVGSAKVPVSEFLGGYAPENCLQFLSFRLWDARGHRNGIVNFSVRVKGAEKAGLAVGSKMGILIDEGMKNFGGGGPVTGIPVNMPWNSLRA